MAALHAVNGHADRFLRTPAQGLDDVALNLGWKSGEWQLSTAIHWYESTEGSLDYGTESNASLSYALPYRQRLLAKWARYDGGDDPDLVQLAPLQAADVEKFWILWEWTWRR